MIILPGLYGFDPVLTNVSVRVDSVDCHRTNSGIGSLGSAHIRLVILQGWVVVFFASYFSSTNVSNELVTLPRGSNRCPRLRMVDLPSEVISRLLKIAIQKCNDAI